MDFVLFLLLNFTIFVRPAEIVPALEGVQLFNYLILATFAVSALRVVGHLAPQQLRKEPISACVLGMLVFVPLSHVGQFDFWSARFHFSKFFTNVLYYFLLISVVNSKRRLRVFLLFVALFTTVCSAIAILQYLEYIDIPSLTVLEEYQTDKQTGEQVKVKRLRSTGIFNDPNDLSMIAVCGLVIFEYFLLDKTAGFKRFVLLLPLGVLFAALLMTKSRGGLLAFMAANGVLMYFRFGPWKTMAAGATLVPLALMFGGRQSDIGGALSGGTAESRVQLWSEGLMLLKQHPFFGIGAGQYADYAGLVAHNSFVHCFTELGVGGGMVFLGLFYFAILSLWQLGIRFRSPFGLLTDRAFRRLHPFLMGIVCGCAISLMSLSRAYSVATYMILGVANAYCLEAARQGVPIDVKLTPQRIAQLALVSLCFVAGIYLFIIVSIR